MPVLVFAIAFLLQGFGVATMNSYAVGLLASPAYGSAVNAVAERRHGDRKPASLLPTAILAAGTPLATWPGWGYAIQLIIIAYSITSITYLVRAVTRLA